VTISKDYWIQTTETTQAQWEAVMGMNPSNRKGADLPMERVSWKDCQEFVKKLNERRKERLMGRTAGLPTEAQWEYACRAGKKGEWGFGDDEEKVGDYAWYSQNSDDEAHPVGQKKPNAWGLYDMHGNASEWCEDGYDEEQYPSESVADPKGPSNGPFRVLRGGYWGDGRYATRSASRDGDDPEAPSGGLRPVLR